MDIDRVILPLSIILVAFLVLVWCGFLVASINEAGRKTLRGRMLKFGCIALGLVAAFFCVTTAWNVVAVHRFWRSHPPAGVLLTVDGRRMHLVCTGTGQPTIVLESGLGDDSLIWAGLQPALSQVTQVCAYDRADLGWSDSRPSARDADNIATELNQLLVQARVKTPVVLMGHSIGGLYIREYRNRFTKEVAGLILVDTTAPYLDKNPAFASEISLPPSWLIRFAIAAGLPRVAGLCSRDAHGAQPQFRKMQAEDLCRLHYSEVSAELASFDRSSEEVTRVGTYEDLPLLIFSQDPAISGRSGTAKPEDVKAAAEWNRLQENLKRLSSQSRRIVVPGSTHYVMLRNPDLVKEEVRRFVDQLRAEQPRRK